MTLGFFLLFAKKSKIFLTSLFVLYLPTGFLPQSPDLSDLPTIAAFL